MRRVLTSFAIVAALGVSTAIADDLPADLIGKWAIDGACEAVEKSIDITADTLSVSGTEPSPITYYENDSPTGNGAIHWSEEGNVDNYEYDAAGARLLYNEQGYGMGVAPLAYTKCG